MAYGFKETIEPEEPMIPAYVATGTITAELEIKSSNATCSYYVKPFTGYNCNVTAVLQRSTNGSTWTNIKTWTEPKAILHDITRTYAVLSGYKYRLQLTVKTYNSSGTLTNTSLSGYMIAIMLFPWKHQFLLHFTIGYFFLFADSTV